MSSDLLMRYAGDGMEITLNRTVSCTSEVAYAFNRLKSIRDTESFTEIAQVIKDGRLGVSTSTKVNSTGELISRAATLTQFGSPVESTWPEPQESANPVIYSQEVAGFSLEDMLALGEDISKFLISLDKDVNGEVTLRRTTAETGIANTNGLNSSWQETGFDLVIGLNFVEGKNLLNVYAGHTSTRLDFDLDALKAEVLESFTLGRKNVNIAPGNYDVLFTPYGFTSLLAPLQACLDGRAIVRGISPFGGKIGDQILSPKFTLINDGVLDYGPRSSRYDAQGVACKRVPLFDKGILNEYLLDLQTAAKLKRQPTGTGGISGISPNNLMVEPGKDSVDDLIAGIKKGVVIDVTMGAWAGNPYSGQVTGNIALGFLVENGKKVGRVKNCMFSLNVFRHLKDHLVALSSETKPLGEMILPYALVEGVSISTESQ